MDKLVEAGIPQYFLEYMYQFYFFDRNEPHGPKVFSIDDLHFGFVVWLVTCSIALAAFLGELTLVAINNGVLRIAELIYLKLILMRLKITLM